MRKIIIISLTVILLSVTAYRLWSSRTATDPVVDDGVRFDELSNGSQPTIPLDGHTHVDTPFAYPETSPSITSVAQSQPAGLVTSLLSNNPSREFSNVSSYLFLDIFDVYECSYVDGRTEKAVSITVQPTNQTGDDEFLTARIAIENWEKAMVADFAQTLWEKPVTAPTDARFTSGSLDTRMTEFVSGQSTHRLYYGWIINSVFFAPSYECLVAAQNKMFAPHSH